MKKLLPLYRQRHINAQLYKHVFTSTATATITTTNVQRLFEHCVYYGSVQYYSELIRGC